MELKKGLLLLLIFSLTLIINIKVSRALVDYEKKKQSSQEVLLEIAQLKNDLAQFKYSVLSANTKSPEVEVGLADNRVANLKAFFRKYNSPLYNHAEKIVEVSDRYRFDYRLLPAIAMQESNLCQKIPPDSFNCWGWGIYGDIVTRFSSYDEAIEVIAAGIKKNYLDKGLVTASQIMRKYTPSSQGSWAYGVNTFLRILE
jgi:hypothetical protein